MQAVQPTYRYCVDAHDVLVSVDAWWLAFASENGASELTERAVLGRSLWDYIADNATRSLYRELHRRVRDSGRPVVVSFRCDSPTVRRHMRLTITQADDGRLDYESVLLRVESVRYLVVLDARARHDGDLLTLCSCCKQALIESAGWLDLEEAAARLRLFDRRRGPQLRYTICPRCAQSADNGDAA